MNNEQKTELLLAILAMDSYNQGYSQGLAHGQLQIGTAMLVNQSNIEGDSAEVSTGFYAATYRMPDGQIVISYRGTDDPSLLSTGTGDVYTGWVAATGTNTAQVQLALDFYAAVAQKTAFEGKAANITLTGHSLGGLLAGYVAALSGTVAHLFDHADWLSFLPLNQIDAEFVQNEISDDSLIAMVRDVANNNHLTLKWNAA